MLRQAVDIRCRGWAVSLAAWCYSCYSLNSAHGIPYRNFGLTGVYTWGAEETGPCQRFNGLREKKKPPNLLENIQHGNFLVPC